MDPIRCEVHVVNYKSSDRMNALICKHPAWDHDSWPRPFFPSPGAFTQTTKKKSGPGDGVGVEEVNTLAVADPDMSWHMPTTFQWLHSALSSLHTHSTMWHKYLCMSQKPKYHSHLVTLDVWCNRIAPLQRLRWSDDLPWLVHLSRTHYMNDPDQWK